MNDNTVKIVLTIAALIIFAAAVYVYRPQNVNRTRLTVTGDAQTKIAPDIAVITFAVVTQNSQAVNAQQENARKSEAVKTAIEAVTEGAKTEIKTDNYSLNPEQDYSGRMPKIVGYEVKNSVTAAIGDLSKVGAVIDAATHAGANSVDGIRFVIGETSPAQGDALAMASRQAMAKAEAIAKSLNGRIVRVVESHEGGAPLLPSSSGYADTLANAAASNANASYRTPVQAGSLDVRSQVILVVEIEI